MLNSEDLYEILQVHPSAHPDVIQAAYRRLALLYHPDKNLSPEAAESMAQLSRAYAVLGDPKKRAEYDLQYQHPTLSAVLVDPEKQPIYALIALLRKRMVTLSDPDQQAPYDRNWVAQGKTPATQSGARPPENNAPREQTAGRSRQSSPGFITIGSRKSDVARIQGSPESTRLHEDTGEEGWSYDKIHITFNRTGRVTEWSIFSRELSDANVRMVPGPNATSSSLFSIDSHKDDVVRLQGTPFRIDIEWGFEFRSERDLYGRDFKIRETWHFPGGTVEFSISTGRVTAWDNKDGSLKAQKGQSYQDTQWTGDDYFTLGAVFQKGCTKDPRPPNRNHQKRVPRRRNMEVWPCDITCERSIAAGFSDGAISAKF